MAEHEHGCTSNTVECFRTFTGCRVKGTLDGICSSVGGGTGSGTVMLFECGWGLSFNHNGAYWTVPPKDIERGIGELKDRLARTGAEIANVLLLAGEQPGQEPARDGGSENG